MEEKPPTCDGRLRQADSTRYQCQSLAAPTVTKCRQASCLTRRVSVWLRRASRRTEKKRERGCAGKKSQAGKRANSPELHPGPLTMRKEHFQPCNLALFSFLLSSKATNRLVSFPSTPPPPPRTRTSSSCPFAPPHETGSQIGCSDVTVFRSGRVRPWSPFFGQTVQHPELAHAEAVQPVAAAMAVVTFYDDR